MSQVGLIQFLPIDNGPEFIHLRSLDIFINETANVFNCPDNDTIVSYSISEEKFLLV